MVVIVSFMLVCLSKQLVYLYSYEDRGISSSYNLRLTEQRYPTSAGLSQQSRNTVCLGLSQQSRNTVCLGAIYGFKFTAFCQPDVSRFWSSSGEFDG